jgi:hypothetical protein
VGRSSRKRPKDHLAIYAHSATAKHEQPKEGDGNESQHRQTFDRSEADYANHSRDQKEQSEQGQVVFEFDVLTFAVEAGHLGGRRQRPGLDEARLTAVATFNRSAGVVRLNVQG